MENARDEPGATGGNAGVPIFSSGRRAERPRSNQKGSEKDVKRLSRKLCIGWNRRVVHGEGERPELNVGSVCRERGAVLIDNDVHAGGHDAQRFPEEMRAGKSDPLHIRGGGRFAGGAQARRNELIIVVNDRR